ncbi:MAG: gamma-glutamyl-gamma-aminobutyrate hydrolase family protein [Betaproteobacteria bacterium]
MRIAVSQRVERIAERNEQRDALDQRLVRWLEQVGVLAYPVPNSLGDAVAVTAWLTALGVDGIVLSGGEDLRVSPERDDTERALLRHARSELLPVLGLCRGMQMLAEFSGGTLTRLPGHVDIQHALDIAEGCALPPTVRSYHAWGLIDCPVGYEVLARAADRSIEAIRHPGLRWEGWMWHPEREPVFGLTELARARALFGGAVTRDCDRRTERK